MTPLALLLVLPALLPCCPDAAPDRPAGPPPDGEYWTPEEGGVEVPVPDGFSKQELNGVPALADEPMPAMLWCSAYQTRR